MSNKFSNIMKLVSKNNINRNISTKKIHNKPYNNKKLNECNFEIPANIFQTWHSKQIPPIMMKSIISIKENNPRFNYYLFDDNDCADFIRNNFPQEVLNAYNNLIPGAYKADLW